MRSVVVVLLLVVVTTGAFMLLRDETGDRLPAPTEVRPSPAPLAEVVHPGDALAVERAPTKSEDPGDSEAGESELAGLMLAASLEEAFPGVSLSSDARDALAAATLRLRDAQLELEQLSDGPDNEEQRELLSAKIDAAGDEVAKVLNAALGGLATEPVDSR